MTLAPLTLAGGHHRNPCTVQKLERGFSWQTPIRLTHVGLRSVNDSTRRLLSKGETVTSSLLGGGLRPVACAGRGRRSDQRLFRVALVTTSFAVGVQAALAQTQPSPTVASSEAATLE